MDGGTECDGAAVWVRLRVLSAGPHRWEIQVLSDIENRDALVNVLMEAVRIVTSTHPLQPEAEE